MMQIICHLENSFENVKLVNLKQSSLFKGNGERCQLVIKDAFIDYCNQDDF